MVDRDKSLEELEDDYWGPPGFPSHLVKTVHHVRTIPLRELTTEHLRIVIGQMMSLQLLIPLALETLERDPLAEGDYYPGDLLRNVLRAMDKEFPIAKEHESRIKVICATALEKLNLEEDDELNLEMKKLVKGYLATEN